MACSAVPLAPEMLPKERLEVLFEELAELTGQRNAIDARIVDIVAEMEHDNLCGMTGAASIPALVAWKTGTSRRNAERIAAIAHRLEEFPRCTTAMREGRLSLDQVGTIAERAAHGSDQHYAELATHATVSQLRTALKLAPKPQPQPQPQPEPDSDARAATPTATGDHQDRRRGLHHLEDHPAPRRGRHLRHRTAIPPRRPHHPMETRPRRRPRRRRPRW